MNLSDCMYDYRYEAEHSKYTCRICGESISTYEDDKYNGLCKDCYTDLN